MTATDFVERVIDALDALAIPYMLVGSFSSNAYGKPRSTKDADFVLQLRPELVGPLTKALSADFVLDPQIVFETITSTTCYRLRHRATPFTVELFELSADPHDQTRFGRRVVAPFGTRTAYIPQPEDVVITKLRWSKQGQRAKDVDDVRDVLALQHDKIDLAYTRQWCDRHGTRDLFERLLAEAQSF